jgi:hypothetical protein
MFAAKHDSRPFVATTSVATHACDSGAWHGQTYPLELGTAEQDWTPRAEIWCPTCDSHAAWRGRDGEAKGDNAIDARSEGRRVRLAVVWSSWLGGRLATDGARLNFLTHIHVRALHYRLSVGSATRDRPPA